MADFADFNAPLGSERARELVAQARRAEPSAVLDMGCGWGELLARMVEQLPGARGLGVDTNATALARARGRARRRGVWDRVCFARASPAGVAGRWPWVSCVGAGHAFGGPPRAMVEGLWGLTAPGGRVLLAEQYWRREPTEAEVAQLYPGGGPQGCEGPLSVVEGAQVVCGVGQRCFLPRE